MSPLRSISPIACLLLLLSLPAWPQGHGGGGGGSRGGGTSTPTRGAASIGNLNPQSMPTSFNNLPTADEEGKLEFRTATILVQVPVVVTDKTGNHVRGLTKDSFHVFESGKEQKLSVFEEVVTTNAKIAPVVTRPGEFQNLTLPSDPPHSVTVIALDTVNTPFLDQSYGRHELIKYLAKSVDSGQVMALMLMTSRGLKVVQGLTGDPEQLAQILKRASGELPAMQTVSQDATDNAAAGDFSDSLYTAITPNTDPVAAMEAFIQRGDAFYAQFQQQNAIETTLNSFLGIAYALNGVPGRKSLLWATGSFPFALTTPSTVPGGYLSTLYERTMQALDEAQISVYPIDMRGLVDFTDASKRRVPTTQQMSNRSWYQQSTIDTLNEFAEMTGGKAFYNTNDLAGSFKRAADDASSYYLLGYYLDNSDNKAGWRTLKVKIDKTGLDIRNRQGFFVTNATVHREITRNTDIANALASPLEGTGIPITMKWLGVSGDGEKKKAEFAVHLPPGGVTLTADNRVNFEYVVTAYAEKAKKNDVPRKFGQMFASSLPDTQMATLRTSGVLFKGALLDVPPGEYAVRLVVRDNISGKVGSVTAPLTVN
jgi:VWFA-related protein